jgi:hypothetical protein
MHVHFVLIAEGTSDEALIPHLTELCIEAGADEATGIAPPFGRLPNPPGHELGAKLRTAIALEPSANLVLILRDADGPDPEPRHAEIRRAAPAELRGRAWVAVVPVHEIEAWLLLDERALRGVAGRPNGKEALNLPKPAAVEGLARPKERLQETLLAAASVTGRRRERFIHEFPHHRAQLLDRLPPGGVLENVPAWVRMRSDLQNAIARLRAGSAAPDPRQAL